MIRNRIQLGVLAAPLLLAVQSHSARADVATGHPAPTFTEQVASLIFNHCASCHRPGEAAPFSLLDFEQVKRKAKTIAKVTANRVMPPWKVEGDYSFRGDRRLTDEQVKLLALWVEAGMPEGPKEKLPALPKFTEGWQLGPPDLVVAMPKGFSVPAEGPDIYRNFVLPLQLTEDKWIQAIDFRPGARSVVHHSLFFFDTEGTARKRDGEDGQPGYGHGMGGGTRGLGGLGGWALGGNARSLPDGLANKLPKGSDLVLSTHFHLSGRPEMEVSTLGLYFAKEPPRENHTTLQLPPRFGAFAGIDIPAGESHFSISDSFVLPVAVKAFGLSAHAHYLGKQFRMTATTPDGTTTTLAFIKDWDFSWQEQYLYQEPVRLPKGTRIDVTMSYDNSAENPRNPTRPPKRVRWGEQSTDEMGSMSLMVVAENPPEFDALTRGYREHVQQAAAARFRVATAAAAGGRANLVHLLFERFDEDHDGRLSRAEAPPRLAAAFDSLDSNHDGFLDGAELQGAADSLARFLPKSAGAAEK